MKKLNLKNFNKGLQKITKENGTEKFLKECKEYQKKTYHSNFGKY
jgi:hypothetical protein